MASWDGRSKGTVLGYKIFVFLIKNLGVRSAYWLLYFVAGYYFLFQKESNKAIYEYFKDHLGFSHKKARKAIYKSYLVFGKTIIDKVAIAAGQRNQFTYEFDGKQIIIDAIHENKGSVLISAHVGNFEISRYFLSELDDDFKINIITTDREDTAIKNYLDSVFKKNETGMIYVQEDMSHIFEINSVLSRNETIVFTGDRFFPKTKTLEAPFLGKNAHFPAGPFMISSRLNVPVLFVYVMKETDKHYHLYARRAKFIHRNAESLLKEYTENLEDILKKYPYQWFNYYNFWDIRP